MNKSNQKTADRMLDDLSEMLKQAENSKGPLQKLKNPEAVKEELAMIKKFMASIDECFEEMQSPESAAIPDDQKELISKAKEIEGEARFVQKAYSKALAKKEHIRKSKNKGKADPKVKERKKLFKSIGGDKKWIPL